MSDGILLYQTKKYWKHCLIAQTEMLGKVSEVKLVNGFIIGWQNPLSFDPLESMHDTMRLNHLMPIYRISKLNLCQVSQSLATALSLLKFQSVTGSLSRLAG